MQWTLLSGVEDRATRLWRANLFLRQGVSLNVGEVKRPSALACEHLPVAKLWTLFHMKKAKMPRDLRMWTNLNVLLPCLVLVSVVANGTYHRLGSLGSCSVCQYHWKAGSWACCAGADSVGFVGGHSGLGVLHVVECAAPFAARGRTIPLVVVNGRNPPCAWRASPQTSQNNPWHQIVSPPSCGHP